MDSHSTKAADATAQAKWVLERVESSLAYVGKKRARFQRMVSTLRLGSLFLAATITILLGIRTDEWEGTFRNVAFILGGLATALGSIDALFNFRKLWVDHEEAKFRFHRLEEKIRYYLAGTNGNEISGEVVSEFHKEYQEIWSVLSTRWISHRRDTPFEQMPPL